MSNLLFESNKLLGSPTPLVFGDTGSTGTTTTTVNIAGALGGVNVAALVAPTIYVDAAASLGGVNVSAWAVNVREVNVAATLGGVNVSAWAVNKRRINIAASLGSVSVEATGFYDNRLTPWKDQRVATALGRGIERELDTDNAWDTSIKQLGGTALPHKLGQFNENRPAAVHQTGVPKREHYAGEWQPADKTSNTAATVHQVAVHNHMSHVQRHETSDRRVIEWDVNSQSGIFKEMVDAVRGQTARPIVQDFGFPMGGSVNFAGVTFFTAPWRQGGELLHGISLPPEPPLPPKFYWNADLLFEFAQEYSPNLVFGEVSAPIVPSAVVVPIKRVYMMLNSASLRRVDGNIYLPTFSMSLSLDSGSWTWGFSANLPGSVLSSLEPAVSGEPVEVEATINGVAYRALVEGITRTRTFGKDTIQVSGRGKSSLLDSPYSPVQNFTNGSTMDASQLFDQVLTANGQPFGWTVDFGLEDWSVPSGVFSHQGSYVSAMTAIAKAAGGYIQPHASSQIVRVLPKYPVAPWNWGTVTADYQLPAAVTTQEAIEWVEKARYNRVFVSGVREGVLGQVTRSGTAGDLVAPMVTDPLITSVIPARNRGTEVLADTGRIANVRLKLPVLAETGIITPGKFVSYVDGATTRLGIVRSVGVEVGMPNIWQTIGVETHV